MLQLTNIKGTDLFIIEVPEDARNFVKSESGKIVYLHGQGMFNMLSFIDVEYDKAPIIGTITKDIIDFDAEKYIDGEYIHEKYCKPKYNGYCENICQGSCYNGVNYDEEMYDILSANGVLFENPLGEPPVSNDDRYKTAFNNFDVEKFNSHILEWQSAQQKIVGKIVVIKLLK